MMIQHLSLSSIVCPSQTYSHTVMCRVCLNSLKNGIRCGRECTAKSLNYIEYLASEDVFDCAPHKLAEHILLNSQYNLLASHLAGFSANLRTRKLRLSVSGGSSLYLLLIIMIFVPRKKHYIIEIYAAIMEGKKHQR